MRTAASTRGSFSNLPATSLSAFSRAWRTVIASPFVLDGAAAPSTPLTMKSTTAFDSASLWSASALAALRSVLASNASVGGRQDAVFLSARAALARVCTASTADRPTTPASTAAAAPVTPVRCRVSPAQRSPRPAARARPRPARRPSTARRRRPAPGTRRSGPPACVAIAFRQTASRALSSDGSSCAGRDEVAGLDLAEDLADVLALERRLAGQQAVQRGAQRVDVGARAQPVEVAAGLLGAHVGRRAQRAAGQRLR